MKRFVTALSLAAALVPAASLRADQVRLEGDLARLQGRWVTRAGARHEVLVTLDVEGNKARVSIATPQGIKFAVNGELRIDETAAPHALDWVGFSGPDEQDLPDIPAIYELSGENFKVCNGGPNNARPSEFKPGENILSDLHVFQRAKSSEDSDSRSTGP